MTGQKWTGREKDGYVLINNGDGQTLGIATALSPQIDLATEPRWMRFADTFGGHTRMTIDMTKAYCDGFQTTEGSKDGWGRDSVNTMVKHFPGGGSGEGGRDAHYAYGKYAVYPGGNFEDHLKPFTEGAFALDGKTKKASAVMPYYMISYDNDQKYNENVGNSYNTYLIQDLLRGELGYEGVVCNEFQLKSITMLKNKDSVLPIKRGIKVYVPTRQIRSHEYADGGSGGGSGG